jgi:hypothetical protein
MSSTARDIFHRHRVTVDEYHRMAEAGIFSPTARVELIEGSVSHLLIEEKTASREPAGGTTDGRDSRTVTTVSE